MSGAGGGGGDRPGGPGVAARAPVSAHAVVNRVFLILLLGGVLLLVPLEITPSETVSAPWGGDALPACQYLRQTGRPCPSCGITRSLVAAAHGDLAVSRRFHPAGVPILAMVLVQIVIRVAFLWPRVRRPAVDVAVSAAMLAAVAWLLNG